MGVIPRSREEQIQWFRTREALWTANATAIGLTAAQMTAFKPLLLAAEEKLDDALAARAASKAATTEYYNASNTMVATGRALVATIKAFAEASNNPNVYAQAQIDPPAPPSPAPPPTAPENLTGSILPTGQVTLKWEALTSGPTSGIFFIVSRKRAGEASFTTLGGTQERAFLDPSPDICAGEVLYQVRAQRGNQASAWTVPISFSVAGGPGVTVAAEPRLAA